MTNWSRRKFMGVAGLAAGGGLVGLNARWPLDAIAAQQATVVPDEILNPVAMPRM